MNEPVRYLVVSDHPTLFERIQSVLARAGIEAVGSRIRCFSERPAFAFDNQIGFCAVDAACLPSTQAARLSLVGGLPVTALSLLLCPPEQESLGVEAIEAGFSDYLLTDNLTRLVPLVRRHLRQRPVIVDPFENETHLRDHYHDTTDSVAFFTVLSARRFVLEGLNPAAERLFGASIGQVLGKTPHEILPSRIADIVIRSFQRGLEGETATSSEQCWHQEGATKPRWHQVLVVPSRHPGQLPHRLTGVWRDITDQKAFEKALCDREEVFRRLVETTNVIPWEADFDTKRFTYVGQQAVKYFGYPEKDWYTDGFWAEHIHPDDREQTVGACVDLASRSSEYEFEYRMLKQSGEIAWIHDLVNVVMDRNGRLLLRGFLVDVTARRQAEEEIRRLNGELEQRVAQRTAQLAAANRELEAFSYSVSHDLRAPLRAIDGFGKALLEDYSSVLDDEGRDMLGRVRAASQRMGELIDDLLTLSRVTRSEMRRVRVNLSELAESIGGVLRQTTGERSVTWVIAPNLVAEGDPALVRVVLENLLGNAWKYTGKQARACIEFGSLLEGSMPAFFVRDDGAGFDPAYANKLFQPFQRLHRPDEFEGHGIGLATVQRIIHRHGGRVWADGVVGQGATFYFTLMAPGEPSAGTGAERNGQSGHHAGRGQPR